MDKQYMKLIERFPLIPIRDEAHNKQALAIIDDLTLRDPELSSGEVAYGQVLVKLIKEFETARYGKFFKKTAGNEALQYLISEHDLSQTYVAEVAGVSRQNMNDFLKGRRSLPKSAQDKLAVYFKLDSEIFEYNPSTAEPANHKSKKSPSDKTA